MSNVVELSKTGRRPHRTDPTGTAATILIFTGVRYERSPERIDLAERVLPRRPEPRGSGRRGRHQA